MRIGKQVGWLLASLLVALWCCGSSRTIAAEELLAAEPAAAADIFDRDNLVAWCIVPFDAKKRGPQERAAMLAKLGIDKLAYDYRAEHIPTFDEELEALREHGIELTAWWFPGELNDEARHILDVLRRHRVQTQLWVSGGGGPTANAQQQRERVEAEARRIRPIAQAAAEIGCRVALYNHGGWFGEPENQIEIIKQLGLPNVGIVYNLHHGHSHLDRFAELMQLMKPHLYALNLNGMVVNGDQIGQKIVPLGQGDLDLSLLKIIRDSGYRGPIGILNHTDEDAEGRLLDNLDGLQWLRRQLDGEPAGPRPTCRTWQPPPDPALQGGILLEGRDAFRQPPLTIECRVALTQHHAYNILAACDEKVSGTHWELFTVAGSGLLTAYLPGHRPDHIRSDAMVCDGQPHDIAMVYEPARVRLYVDGQLVADEAVERTQMAAVPGGFALGRLVEGTFYCHGRFDWVRLSRGARDIPAEKHTSISADEQTEQLWRFSDAPERLGSRSGDSAPQVPPYDPQLVSKIVQDARQHGNAERGLVWFASATSACISCHKVGEHGGSVGPDLSEIGKQRTPEEIVESLYWPQRKVAPEYIQWVLATTDGAVVRGYRVREDDHHLVLRDPSTGQETTIARDEIEEQLDGGSPMPDELMAVLPPERQFDLVRFLLELGSEQSVSPELIASLARQGHHHEPAVAQFDLAPLVPEDWPNRRHPINRRRMYDWYAKQAEHFRQQRPLPALLGEFPGLDGGIKGHWGDQDEQSWDDGRWNETDLGVLQAGVFHGPDVTVVRGVCVRIGDDRELSVCFNPDTLTYDAVWSGGFVKFSDVRHGFMHGLQMDGQLKKRRTDEPPGEPFQYHGYYRYGDRIVFAYRIGDVEFLDSPWVEQGQFVRHVAPRDEHPLRACLAGGPSSWPQVLPTRIVPGQGRPYAVDTIELPVENPWKALFFCGDHDFLPDGSAMVCTMQGDVWHVTGLDSGTGDVGEARWRRFAAGLHHALGLVVDGQDVYVQGRDQITRLRDLNGDGEADFYECFSNAFVSSPAGHDFVCGLQRDDEGYFYTASGNQGLVRISPDGQRGEVIATGFRNPDGLGIMSDGTITVPCSEGEWTPASMITAVVPPFSGHDADQRSGRDPTNQTPFYGYGGPRGGQRPELPLVYIPRGLDNSSGGQVLITSDRWGPLQGQMIHFSFGAATHFLLLTDQVRGQKQGAIVPLVGDFQSGVHRGRFHPVDGQLYVTGMSGWGCYAPDDGCFQRVRYTGDPVQLPIGFHVHENGVLLEFAEPLDPDVVERPDSHFAQCWNYRYSSAYGSAEYSTQQRGVRGHDVLIIAAAHLLEDGRRLFLEIPELQAVNQLQLHVRSASDQVHDLFVTVHQLDAPYTDHPGYVERPKTLTPHPIEWDLMLATKRVPNPWQREIKGAREVTIEAGKNLTFRTREFRVRAGEAIALTLDNPDVVPHNWALLRPDALQRVGEMANRMVSDPEAAVRHYVPQTGDVLAYTDIVGPREQFTIYFRAPAEPGRYPYLCTFPGHWMVMNGVMVVEPPE